MVRNRVDEGASTRRASVTVAPSASTSAADRVDPLSGGRVDLRPGVPPTPSGSPLGCRPLHRPTLPGREPRVGDEREKGGIKGGVSAHAFIDNIT